MRLLSSETKDLNSRLVDEAEQVLVREFAEAARRTTEVQKTMDNQFQTQWKKKTEAHLRDMRESNSAQVQQLAASLQQSKWERQQLHIAHERCLRLEAQTLRMSQDMDKKF